MICDMCGSESELFKAKIEGTMMNVCKTCSKYGEVISKINLPEKKKRQITKNVEQEKEPEKIELLSKDFAIKIRKKREQLNLDQEEFAKKINQKRSFVNKIENNELEPNLEIAKKLEKLLDLKLIEEYSEETEDIQEEKKEDQTLTLGDLIKIKKRSN